MKKKVGIITLPLHHNYGGILQAFALQKYLENLGYEVVFIDRQHEETTFSALKLFIKKIIHPNYTSIKKQYEQNFQIFIEQYINPRSKQLNSNYEVEEFIKNEKINFLITGSDQVFRIDYAPTIYKELFLNFNLPVKKISYAASFGHETWIYPHKKDEVKNYLKQFSAVSVREKSGLKICLENFNIEASHNLDPTLLFSNTDYLKFIEHEKTEVLNTGVLSYILDNNSQKEEIVLKISSLTNLSYFNINKPTINIKNHRSLQNKQKYSVANWIMAFNTSKYIITDSFHGTIFAIIFQKPFLVIGNKERGVSRFLSLLEILNLEDRIIYNLEDITDELLNNIDYSEINKTLELEKDKTLNFFKNNLI